MTQEDQVRQASDRFYAALTNMARGDAGPMGAVWAHGADVTALHPIGPRGEGWDQVKPQFEQVSAIASGGQVRMSDQLVRVGTDLAYEVGIEVGELTLAGQTVVVNQHVTNIYRREGGEWKMVHHHSDASPAMNDVVSRLPPPPA
jgi:ketosteroid isomerase-like protein